MTTTPRTIPEYLEQLRAALHGADPALVQDALYDAEEHLRSELAENPDKTEAELLARMATSYGAPAEVAALYVQQEAQVEQALRSPPPPPQTSKLGQFFGIAADPRAYAALFYMLLSLATGIFYFTWTVTGLSLSLGLSILIFGLVIAALFFGSVRVLSLVEGRLVEVMLGERMPRRPVYAERNLPLMKRIGAMFTDPRTWTTMLYFILMLPLGIIYFTLAIVGISVGLSCTLAPVAHVLWWIGLLRIDFATNIHFNDTMLIPAIIADPLCFVIGLLFLFGVLHVARGVGKFQGALAKHLLVRSAA